MSKYPFIDYKTIEKYLPEMEREKVSIIARGKGGFLEIYKKFGTNLPTEWSKKRGLFLTRTLGAYRKRPSYRRMLSLIAWGYMPH